MAIGLMVRHPAAQAILLTSRASSVDRQRLDEVPQRLGTLGEPHGLGRPVVHLQVDIEGVVVPPGRGDALVPDALQVGGHRPRPARREQEIPPKIELQRHQVRVRTSGMMRPQPRPSVDRDGVIGGKDQLYPVEELAVALHMSFPQNRIRVFGRGIEICPCQP